MSVIADIDRQHLFLVKQNEDGSIDNAIPEQSELLRLAKIGELYQEQINECADVLGICHDESCKGNMYCRAYKDEVIVRHET